MRNVALSLRNEHGKAESKMPAYITLAIMGLIGYWAYNAGIYYWYDLRIKHGIEEKLRYDTFKIMNRPSIEQQRDLYLTVLKMYGVQMTQNTAQEWLKVGDDPTPNSKFFTVDLKYKRVIKWPVLGTKEMWFEHKIYPRK